MRDNILMYTFLGMIQLLVLGLVGFLLIFTKPDAIIDYNAVGWMLVGDFVLSFLLFGWGIHIYEKLYFYEQRILKVLRGQASPSKELFNYKKR